MRFFFILCFISCCLFGYTQSIPELVRLADKQFENNLFIEAVPYYKRVFALDKDNYYAGYQLAYCYELTLQYEDALSIYKKLSAIKNHDYYFKSLYKYATLNKLDGDYTLADSIYLTLLNLPDVEPKLLELANRQHKGCLLAMSQLDRGFKIKRLEKLNSQYHDFGATTYPSNGNVVFATTRNLSDVQFVGTQFSGVLPDLLMFSKKSKGSYKNVSHKNGFVKLNTKWSEGSGCFSADGSKFYFTSCQGEEDEDSGCKIYYSLLQDNKWNKAIPLNEYINEEGSENKQPSLSSSGDTLFFVSNRSGGMGGNDIWMSLRGGDGEEWLPSINMGDVINTVENEISPYYSSVHGSLLFSSNGHVSQGGYDIYGAKGLTFFYPDLFNIGQPFNSTWDDLYFNISAGKGHISSNRDDKESLDIYGFDVKDEDFFLSLLFSKELMTDGQIVSKHKGVASFDVATFRAEDYESYALFQPVVTLEKDKENVVKELLIPQKATSRQKPENFEIGGSKIFFEYSSDKLSLPAKVALDEFYEAVKDIDFVKTNILGFTDVLGESKSNIDLSKKRGERVKKYLVNKGLDASRLNVFARGELSSESNNFFYRVFDRCVELNVVVEQPFDLLDAKNVILREEMSLVDVAKLLDISLTKIFQWNGKSTKKYGLGSIIRLYISDEKYKKINSKYFITESNVSKVFK